MSLTLSAISPVTALKVAASRSHASPVQASVSLTLGGGGGGRLQCHCLGCAGSPTAEATRVAAGSVDYTDRIKKSGRNSIDALLAGGNRWFHTAGASGEMPSATARKSLSFSFIDSSAGLNSMDASGFQALDNGQRQRVRDAFGYLSSLIDVGFTEVASGGDLQFGSNSQASSAGYARYPNEGSQVFMANNQAGFGAAWSEGSYVWQTLLHETAHALGLKHPGNYNAGGGGTPGPYLPGALDNRGNTIMSYRNAGNMTQIAYQGSSFSKSVVNADGFQAFDIAALQYLYGASTSITAQSYALGGSGAFSKTLWNPNAGSQIDLSASSGINVLDLRAGKRSSIDIVDPYAQMPFSKTEYLALKSGGKTIASILGKPTYTGEKNLTLAAGSQFTKAVGGSGTDSVIANKIGGEIDAGGGDDRVFWTGGNLSVTGGAGTDTLLLKKVYGARWTVAQDGSQATLTRTDKLGNVTTLSTVQMSGIESVRHWDGVAKRPLGLALYSAPASPVAGFSAVA